MLEYLLAKREMNCVCYTFRAQYKHHDKGLIEMKPVALEADYCNSWMRTVDRKESNVHSGANTMSSGPQKYYVMNQDYMNSSTLQA